MKEDDLKVTDRRIFTPEGELKDEYRYLDESPPPPAREEPVRQRPEGRAAREAQPRPGEGGPAPTPEAPALEISGAPPGLGGLTFFDLVAAIAEPASIYLGDVPLPGGQSGEDLEMARLHIDLLAVLRQKSLGNLTAQEGAFLDDVTYRLRMRYVQKRG